MALTIPHPSRTGSTHMTLIASVVVIVGSLAFGGYQLATTDGSGGTSSAVQTVERPFPQSWYTGVIAPVEEPAVVGSLGGVLNPGGQNAVGATTTDIAEARALAEHIASIEARYPGGGEAGRFESTTVEPSSIPGFNNQWPTAPAAEVTQPSDYPFSGDFTVPETGAFAPKAEAHPLAGLNDQWPTAAESTPERVGPGGNVN